MFKVISVGEGLGDCFIIKVGLDNNPVRILVDGRYGNKKNISQIKEYLGDGKVFDYIVVTHCDADHIKGVVRLFEQEKYINEYTKIIYNCVMQPVNNDISYKDAEVLERLTKKYCIINTCSKDYKKLGGKLYLLSKKNRNDFDTSVYSDTKPVLTLLAPDIDGINEVYMDYLKWKKKDTKPKKELINQNSIVFLLEYDKKRALFTGDANFKDIEKILNTIEDLADKKIDLIKVPHHGVLKNCEGMVDYAIAHDCERLLVLRPSQLDFQLI